MKCLIAAMIVFACSGFAQATIDLSGTWGFTHANDQFQGWVVLRQAGTTYRGTWHTSKGKSEPDDEVTARLDGNTVTLWRFIGSNKQSFSLTLSADANRMDGFGDGFFLNHTNLSMQRSAGSTATKARSITPPAAAADLSGLWSFTHFNDRFQGTVVLRKEGSDYTGTWHTSKGKTEPDDSVSVRVEGKTVWLWRFIGDAQQRFLLTLSGDKTRLDGFGDGYFLSHTNLNMQRVVEQDAATVASPQAK